MSEQKKIDRDTYLRALGLFALASQHYAKLREAELALGRTLGFPVTDTDFGHISDSLYNGKTVAEFEISLKREGIVVADEVEKAE